jgi:hypothetical protein
MSVRIMLIDATGPDWLGELDTLTEAIDDVHQHWLESPAGPQGFVLQAENGFVLAMMMRSQDDSEVCITAFADGRLESHRCRYVLDGQQRYVSTEVTALIRVADAEVVIP